MDELYKAAKLNLTSTIFSEYNKMRENEFFCNFEINVGSKSFPVHCSLLIAASKYFKAMFSSNMEEVEQEFIDMKDVDTEGVKYCLEFIYTREIDLSIAPVELTLHASHLMQLDDLTNLCFEYLKLHITPESSILTLKLAQLYGRDELINMTDQYITDHLKDVSLTDSFYLLEEKDLIRHLNIYTVDHRVSWQAVIKWVLSRNEDSEQRMIELVKSLQIEKFPFIFLLETVLNEPLVQGSKISRDLVINYLFADAGVLKENLSLQTFFTLRELAKNNKILNGVDFPKLFDNFMEVKFEELAQEDKFSDLEEKEILHLFQSQETKYFTEKTKFDAALKWAKTNSGNRNSFPRLFTFIKLDLLSPEFIQQTVLTEPLVKESHECKDLLLDYYARGEIHAQQIACLHSETEEIQFFNPLTYQWYYVTRVKTSNYLEIVSVKNKLFVLRNKTILHFGKDGTWRKITTLPRIPEKVVNFQDRIYCIDNDFMFCYDPVLDTWINNLPGCGLDSGCCVAASSECIYAICLRTYNHVYVNKKFDPKTGKWSNIASMNKGRLFASASAMNRMVFVMGGRRVVTCLNSVECYNPVVESWTEIAGMCCVRSHFSSCVVNNKLYVVGGTNNLYKIEVYDEESGKWKTVQTIKNWHRQIYCCVFSP